MNRHKIEALTIALRNNTEQLKTVDDRSWNDYYFTSQAINELMLNSLYDN